MSEFSIAILTLGACVFAVSASAKLRNQRAYQSFRAGLRETALMPDRLLPAVAAVLSGAESVTAAGLAAAAVLASAPGADAHPVAEVALIAAASLTAALLAGVAVVMSRGTRARCACFGTDSGRPLGVAHLIRNLFLLGVLAAGTVGSSLSDGRPAPLGAVVAAAVGAVAAQLFIRWEELAELFVPIPSPPAASPPVQRPSHRPR